MVPIYSSSIEERVFELLSFAGMDLKAIVVVPHMTLNWILWKKFTASCRSDLSARFLLFMSVYEFVSLINLQCMSSSFLFCIFFLI